MMLPRFNICQALNQSQYLYDALVKLFADRLDGVVWSEGTLEVGDLNVESRISHKGIYSVGTGYPATEHQH